MNRIFLLLLTLYFNIANFKFIIEPLLNINESNLNYLKYAMEETTLAGGYKNSELQEKHNRIIKLYDEFLSGKRTAEGIDMDYLSIPTGEPERRYYTQYAAFDSNGDGMPELHVRTGRDYYIFTCKDDKIVVWECYFSNPLHHHPLKDGAFIEDSDQASNGLYYNYYRLDINANIVEELNFYREDSNYDYIYDEEDTYVFNEIECTKSVWESKSKQYLNLDSNEDNHILNEIDWQNYCLSQ